MFLKPIKDINFLSRGDFLDGLNVERTTNFNVFLSDGTRRSWRRVMKEIESGVPVSYRSSPQVHIDWTCREQAAAYLKLFSMWGTYQSGTTMNCHKVATLSMVEVIDGVLFHDGEWWVVGPSGTYNDWGRKVEVANCLYSGVLCRVPNNWWQNVNDAESGNSIWVNVFFVNKDYPTEWRDQRISSLLA